MRTNSTAVQVSSIDPEEVAYYERLAHTWWDPRGPFWPLHRLNALRVDYLRAKFCDLLHRDPRSKRPLSGLDILDIGCGGGILSEAMASLGASVTGIDVVERNIRVASLHAQEVDHEVRYRYISAEALVEEGARFDIVLNMEVVEHVADLPNFMKACCQLVKPGGLMSIATINRNPLAWLVAIVGAEYILRWLPRGTHHYSKLRRPDELKELLTRQGFGVLDEIGVRVNPFMRTMHLTGFKGINYMMIAEREAGR